MTLEIPRFKPTAGAGRCMYNPHHLPLMWAGSANTQLKYATNTAYAANSANFFTQLTNTFAAVKQLTAAAEYQTLVDITGAGWLGWVLTPTYFFNGASHTQYIRFTVDGVEYEFSKTFTEPGSAVGYRAAIGAVFPVGANTGNTGGGAIATYLDSGFAYANGQQDYMLLTPIQNAMTFSAAMLRFDQSLKVELKTSDLDGTAQYATGACDYCLEVAA